MATALFYYLKMTNIVIRNGSIAFVLQVPARGPECKRHGCEWALQQFSGGITQLWALCSEYLKKKIKKKPKKQPNPKQLTNEKKNLPKLFPMASVASAPVP